MNRGFSFKWLYPSIYLFLKDHDLLARDEDPIAGTKLFPHCIFRDPIDKNGAG